MDRSLGSTTEGSTEATPTHLASTAAEELKEQQSTIWERSWYDLEPLQREHPEAPWSTVR